MYLRYLEEIGSLCQEVKGQVSKVVKRRVRWCAIIKHNKSNNIPSIRPPSHSYSISVDEFLLLHEVFESQNLVMDFYLAHFESQVSFPFQS